MLRIPIAPMAEIVKREIGTLKKAIADVTGRDLDVRIVAGPGSAPPPPAPAQPPQSAPDGAAGDDGEDPDDLMRYALERL